jgi:hypothetical protein
MTDDMHALCQKNAGMRSLWARGKGPGQIGVLPQVKTAKAKKQPKPIPTEGPGTNLEKLFLQVKIEMPQNCPCRGRKLTMNSWGPKMCRKHFWEIVGWLKDSKDQFSRRAKIRAAYMTFRTGLIFRINPFSPLASFVRLAIKQAEKLSPTDSKTAIIPGNKGV